MGIRLSFYQNPHQDLEGWVRHHFADFSNWLTHEWEQDSQAHWRIDLLLYQYCQKLEGKIPERQFWHKQLPEPILMRFLELMVFDYDYFLFSHQQTTILPKSYGSWSKWGHYLDAQHFVNTYLTNEKSELWDFLLFRSLLDPNLSERSSYWSDNLNSIGYLTPSEASALVEAILWIFTEKREKIAPCQYELRIHEDALDNVLQECLLLEPGNGLITLIC